MIGRVLVVDDDALNRKLLRRALVTEGMSVLEAADGVHATRPELGYLEQVGHVIDAAAAVEARRFDPATLVGVADRNDALGRLARVFARMADEVRAREERLEAEIRELRIEIDDGRQARKVDEITQTDYFKDLRSRAGKLRRILEG